MVDIHAHIIHGVDDGPQTIDESIELLKQSRRQGVEVIIATPHYRFPLYLNENLEEKFEELERALYNSGFGIKIRLGNEIFLDEMSMKAIKNKSVKSLGENKYLLIELPKGDLCESTKEMIYTLLLESNKLVFAHIERYEYFLKDLELLSKYAENGILMQLNASFIVNKRSRKLAFKLIKKNLVHIVGSDCHSVKFRPNRMGEAYSIVQKKFGKNLAEELFKINPGKIIG